MEEELDPKIADLMSQCDRLEEQLVCEDQEEKEEVTLTSSVNLGSLSSCAQNYITFNSSNLTAKWANVIGGIAPTQYVTAVNEDGKMVIDLSKTDDPVFIRTRNGEVNLDKLQAMMDRLDEILCVVEKINAEDENFPALATAYRHFRVVEAMARAVPKDDGE